MIKHGVIPTKAVLAEIAQEMKYYDEKERYERLMLIQGYESDVQVTTSAPSRPRALTSL